jgi:hypothetical protein
MKIERVCALGIFISSLQLGACSNETAIENLGSSESKLSETCQAAVKQEDECYRRGGGNDSCNDRCANSCPGEEGRCTRYDTWLTYQRLDICRNAIAEENRCWDNGGGDECVDKCFETCDFGPEYNRC